MAVATGKNEQPNNKKTLTTRFFCPHFLIRWTPPFSFSEEKGRKNPVNTSSFSVYTIPETDFLVPVLAPFETEIS